MAEIQYPFLDLKTPKDTTASSLNNKVAHSIYQTIVKKTSIQNAKNSSLFTTETKVDGIILNLKTDYTSPIKRLIEDKLVQQFFYFYSRDQKIALQPCFIAIPTDKSETLIQIFEKLLNVSINNIEYFLDFQFNFNPDQLKFEYERNLKENLPLIPENYPNNLIKIFESAHKYKDEISLEPGIVQATIKEIEEELIFKKRIVKIEEGLYIPLSIDEISLRFEIADNFIKKNMRPLAGTDAASEITKINTDEEIFRLTPFHEIDLSFQVNRARIFQNIANKPDSRYPGQLPILTVILLEELVSEQLKKQYDEKILKETDSLKNRFLEYSENWENLIHFFGEDLVNSKHPKVWENLKKDNHLAYTEWYLKKEEILIFSARKPIAFSAIIRSMDNNPPIFSWQILAFKQLFESYEKYFSNFFTNKEILNAYSNLLRLAYIDYFPWFYQILIFIDFFKDIFFASAKQKINRQQISYRDRIKKNKLEIERKKTHEKLSLLDLKNKEKIRGDIINALEDFYLKQNIIPTVSQIMQKCKIKDMKQLQNITHKENFQMVPLIKGGGFENIAILFPMDHNWRVREAQLKKNLSEKIESYVIDPHNPKNELPTYRIVYNHILTHNKKIETEIPEDT